MNRNNERHFNQVPETHVSRTRFNRDQNVLTTFDAGKLPLDRKSTRLNSSHSAKSRMPSSA